MSGCLEAAWNEPPLETCLFVSSESIGTDAPMNDRIQVTLSDPWELGESLHWRPLTGRMKKLAHSEAGGAALIVLDEPIRIGEASYSLAMAQPRHEGRSLLELYEGARVFCSFTGVSESDACSQSPLSDENWRGGLAFIGELELVADPRH